jgi:hypothetical protein
MERVIVDPFRRLTEVYQLLPAQHYGGRPAGSTDDAIMVVSENIHEAWRWGQVSTTVFMDVDSLFHIIGIKKRNRVLRYPPHCSP